MPAEFHNPELCNHVDGDAFATAEAMLMDCLVFVLHILSNASYSLALY